MKIGYLITRMDEYGGAQVHVRDLALWMKARGHDVIVYSGAPGLVSDELQAAGIQYHEIPSMHRAIHPIKDIKAICETVRTLKQTRPDILTCHSSKAGIVGRIAARVAGIPSVFTAHNWTFGKGAPPYLRPVYWAIEWACGKVGNHIITVSDFGRAQALTAMVAAPSKITAIHNGMPDATERRHAANHNSPPCLTMIARIGWPKDHTLLIEALSSLKHHAWSLNLVGGGDDTALKFLAQKHGLADRIRFMGERKDIPAILAQSDIFVLASLWEGFPLSILEAMRAGLPVVASDVGGSKESVLDGHNGFIVLPSDREALSKALEKLIVSADLRAEMGQKGRTLFEERFTFDAMADKTLTIYKRV
jgi:glycosyltransferase involved in cell wall biosynthesis